jgi:signal transduction histidine kinase
VIAVERQAPPASGWTDVTLPDRWSSRWPDFGGVVWYRLHWHQPDAAAPVALLVDYISMAGAVYVNGSLLERDAQLTEPLPRAWHRPRYVLLPSALLRRGDNSIVLRVSGFAEYKGGIGRVEIGHPAVLQTRFARATFFRQTLQVFSFALSAALGSFFLALWLLRRKNVFHGWLALLSLAWCVVASNQVIASPWPFTTTHGWAITTASAFVCYIQFHTLLVLRFCRRRWRSAERSLLAVALLCTGALVTVPHAWLHEAMTAMYVVCTVQFCWTNAALMVAAWRRGGGMHKALGLCASAFVAAAVHDLLALLGTDDGFMFHAVLTSQLHAIAMALVLAQEFMYSLNQVEGYGRALERTVMATRAELTRTLREQHERQIVNARRVERQQLAHDLHDGFGGTLVNTIAELEQAPRAVTPRRFLAILKELRDDLRLVLESTDADGDGAVRLVEKIAALRHRLTQRLELQGIACGWHFAGLDDYAPSASRCLQILRLLQEALTNVAQHSRADRADVRLYGIGQFLHLEIHDNGVGFDPAAPARGPGTGTGTGLRSMRARAQRMGGTLEIRSTAGATVLHFTLPAGF